jgi:hypothetical protein
MCHIILHNIIQYHPIMSETSQPTQNLRCLAQLARTFFEPFPSLVLLMLFKSFLWIPGGGSGALVTDIECRMM